MPLTDPEKVMTRFHLGYMNVTEVETFALGTPAATETSFVIEAAMNKVPELALPLVRRILGVLDTILFGQKVADLENLAVSALGNIKLRPDEMAALDKEYEKWQGHLANTLGVYVNPYSKVQSGGGINVPILN